MIHTLMFLHFAGNCQWSVLKNQNFAQINEIQPHFVMWQSAVVYNEMVWKTLVSVLNLDH